ncbi:MAG TPA: hypothetical protein VL992_00315 [Tepidisphaeraceae bacterium]|nr:hypothetical protein [Tepidisphaeraceae bacterium]
MTPEVQQPPPQIVRQGYEPPDVSNRSLMIFFLVFVVVGAAINVGIWGLLKLYMAEPRAADVITSAAPAPDRFPPPNLQPIEKHNQLPWQDMQDLRREKNAILEQLGWPIDPGTGAATIPDAIVNQLAAKEKKP